MEKYRDYKGTVKWFNTEKGYGFIKGENNNDVFVHYSGITGMGFRTLEEGQEVQFNLSRNEKGLMAVDVIVVGDNDV